MEDDTIAALSTPLGRGGIALIRLSGQETLAILKEIAPGLPRKIIPRFAYHAFIQKDSRRIDECVITFFEAPRSYTGENLAEISIHSNPFIIEAVLDLIFEHQARQALPGEFTYRAFKNSKMDLMQAESVSELIEANSRHYALMKFDNLEGKLSTLVQKLRNQLIDLGIRVESIIEFQEDQFLESIGIEPVANEIEEMLEKVLAGSRFNDILDRGLKIVIAGKVNVGKSSLFNHLLMEERSIISSIPGTTRDFIKEKIYIDGNPFEIIDVAGMSLRNHGDIESIGIQRSLEKIESSDAVIFMLDASREIGDSDLEIYRSILNKKKIVVVNKIDIVDSRYLEALRNHFKIEVLHEISVKENINLDVVSGFLKGLINTLTDQATEFTINYRQKEQFVRLYDIMMRVGELVRSKSVQVEIVAEEVRKATHILGELTGEITSEDLLNGIFSKFCIGK